MINSNLITLNDPTSYTTECYKMLRTSLNFIKVDEPNKVILFTSSTMTEGKSTTVGNVAVAYAQEGKKVLVLECDLRRPTVHKLFRCHHSPGLVEVLFGKREIERVAQEVPEVENLFVITAGHLPPSPADLLGSKRLKAMFDQLRDIYDVILVDAPPVLHVTDAVVVSRFVDGVVMVVALYESKKDEVLKAKKELEKVGDKLLGTVVTKVRKKNKQYRYAYEADGSVYGVNKRRRL